MSHTVDQLLSFDKLARTDMFWCNTLRRRSIHIH